MNKKCSRCKGVLSKDNFTKATSNRDGLSYTCRKCNKIINNLSRSKQSAILRRKEYLLSKRKKCISCNTLITLKSKRCRGCISKDMKLGILKYGTPFKSGSQHLNWNNGTTELRKQIQNLKEYKDWRLSVFVRDNYTCQGCKKVGGYLNAHHIKFLRDIIKEFKIKDGFDALKCKIIWSLDNGVTLCVGCHDLVHKNRNWYN